MSVLRSRCKPELVVGFAILLAGCGAADDSTARHVDGQFYAGRVITYLVGSKPGGGYDTYARLVARYMQKYLPGARIRVKNVPGAASIVAANQLGIAPPDGLTIGTFNSGLFYSQLLGDGGLQSDLGSYSWIGKAAVNERVMLVSRKSRFQSIGAMRGATEPVLFGAASIGSAARNEALILGHILGIPIRIVTGFSGNDSQMSLMRGEIDGAFGSYSSYRSFIARGDGKLLLTIGRGQEMTELLQEAVGDARDKQARDLLRLIDSVANLGRVTAAPPNVPAQRLAVLRDAYARALSDPGFLADAERLDLPVEPLSGVEVAARAAAILDQPAQLRELIRDITRSGQSR